MNEFHAQAHETIKRAADLNKRAVDWQLGQMKIAEKQIADNLAYARTATEATAEAFAASQQAVVDAFAPTVDTKKTAKA